MAITGGSLSTIYDRLNSVPEYNPFSANTFADWSMEAGDLITVNRDGTTYQSPIHTSSLNWKGQPQISVSGDGSEARDSITKQTKSRYGRGLSGMRNDQNLNLQMGNIYTGLSSRLEFTEERLKVEFRGLYDGLQSDLEFTRSRLRIEFSGLYDGLRSDLEFTRSRLRVEFSGLYDGLRSDLEFTRSRLRVEFEGLYDGLSSALEFTRSRLQMEFSGLYDGLRSELEFTRSRLSVEFSGLYDGLKSDLEFTRSRLSVEFSGLYDGLKSDLEFTRSRLMVEFSGLYDGLKSDLEFTRSRLRVEFSGLYDGLKSDLEFTRSRLRVEFSGLYDGLKSDLEMTRSRLRVEFSGMYDGLSSSFEITRSRMAAEFKGAYDGLSSAFEITRSRLAVDFKGAYDGLTSSFEITRSRMAVDFKGAYDGLSSHFELTRSSMVSEFSNVYTGLSSQITQNASKIGLVVDGNGVKRASIVAAINGNTSSVDIDADNISIGTSGSAQVHISDVFSVVSGAVTISGDTYQTGAIHPNGISMAAGSDITFTYGSAPPKSYVLNQSVITNMIVNADIDGNTLRLWKIGDEANSPSVTFSKATSLPDGTWSGGKYTIHAQQNNSGVTTNVATHTIGFAGNPDEQLTLSPGDAVPQVVGTSKYISVPIELRAWKTENNEETYDVVYNPTLTVNATNAWNAGRDSVTVDTVALADNFGPLKEGSSAGASDVRYNVYIQGIASNGDKEDNLFTLGLDTYNSGESCVILRGPAFDDGTYVTNVVIGRLPLSGVVVGSYNQGWGDAYAKVSIPTNKVLDYSTYTIAVPTALVGGPADTYVYRVINTDGDDNKVDLQVKTGKDGQGHDIYTTVARYAHNKLNGVGITNFWTNSVFPLIPTARYGNTSLDTKTIGFTNACDVYLEIEKNGTPVIPNNGNGKFVNVPVKVTQHIAAQGNVPASDQTRYTTSLALVDVTESYNKGFDAVELGDPEWLYTNQNDDTQYTGGATNSLIVEADQKTDNTQRKVSYAVSLFLDRENKRVDLRHMNVPHARIDVSGVFTDGRDSVDISSIYGTELGGYEVTRERPQITATASNGTPGSTTLRLRKETFNYSPYTIHHGVSLYGYYPVSGGQNYGVIGRIDIEDIYTGGWQASASFVNIPTGSIGDADIDGSYNTINLSYTDKTDIGVSYTVPFTYTLSVNDGFQPTGTTTKIRAAEVKSGSNVLARITIPMDTFLENEYKRGWGAARTSVDDKTYTVNGNTYRFFPGVAPDSDKMLQYMKVGKPNQTVDGSISDIMYWVTSDKNTAYINYNSSSGAKVAKYDHNQYDAGWGAARGTVASQEYVVNSKTYKYFPALAPTTPLSYIKVALPNSTVDGSKADYVYYAKGGSGVAYICYGSSEGPVVAQATHSYTKTATDVTNAAPTGDISIGSVVTGTVYQTSIKVGDGTWKTGNNIDLSGIYDAARTGYVLASGVTSGAPTFHTYSSQSTKTGVDYFAYQNGNATNSASSHKAPLSISLLLESDDNGNMTATVRGYLGKDPDKNTGSKILKIQRNSPFTDRELYCSKVEQTRPGATTYFYYFRLEGNYNYTQGSKYKLYRKSW